VKLATIRDGSRDGRLVVVDRALTRCAPAGAVARTLQEALDRWESTEAPLRRLADALEHGTAPGTEPFEPTRCGPPLPRAYEWVDGSAYLNHVILVRKARKAEPPATLTTDPLVYQGGASDLLGPTDPIPLRDPSWGLDFEGELAVILGDVPVGTTTATAAPHVRLLMLVNDVTLRNLIPKELEKGFGFFQSKPATAFSPVAVTPDELGPSWRDGRVHGKLRVTLDGAIVGDVDAGPTMHFSFFDLVQHLAKTRAYGAGTILGSGTVSSPDRAQGISCLAERRMIETIEEGAPKTPFLVVGQRIRIEAFDPEGRSIFGAIDQEVVSP